METNATKTKKIKKSKEGFLANPSYRVHLFFLMLLFFFYSFIIMFPISWVLFNTLKGKVEFATNPWALPSNPFDYLSNYLLIFTDPHFNIGEMFFWTVVYAVSMPTVSLLTHAMASYTYAKYNWKLKKLFYFCMILPMFIVIVGSGSAKYKLYVDLNIFDNMLPFILTNFGCGGVTFLLLAGVFTNISDSYREAAILDGAGNFRVFLQIYIPQAIGILSAMWIMSFISMWNDFQTLKLYLPSYPTLSTGIYELTTTIEKSGQGEYQKDYPKLFSAMICSIIPVLIIYVVFQDTIMKMTFGGGVKG